MDMNLNVHEYVIEDLEDCIEVILGTSTIDTFLELAPSLFEQATNKAAVMFKVFLDDLRTESKIFEEYEEDKPAIICTENVVLKFKVEDSIGDKLIDLMLDGIPEDIIFTVLIYTIVHMVDQHIILIKQYNVPDDEID